ncbi:hypothetical protein DFH06DRAFT_1209405 [Mycena polygramma]|nr:hypothetical protein DFH06DRAFT_1209405 [Mycena polygramma]
MIPKEAYLQLPASLRVLPDTTPVSLGGSWRWRLPGFHHILSTLNPSLLQSSDHLDLSNRKEISLAFPSTKLRRDRTRSQLCYASGRRIPFPEHSRGFLYFHIPPHAAAVERSLRFRLTQDNAPSSFDSGADLTLPSGAPWQVILPQLLTGTAYTRVCEQLLHEGLATKDLLIQCRALFGAASRRISPSLTLFRLQQEFPVNLAASKIQLTVVGPDALHSVGFPSIFSVAGMRPWTGTALARFEPSTRHAPGRRVLHLRIAKIVEPVSGPDAPKAGELLSVWRKGRMDAELESWACDIDLATRNAQALRVLWDAPGMP